MSDENTCVDEVVTGVDHSSNPNVLEVFGAFQTKMSALQTVAKRLIVAERQAISVTRAGKDSQVSAGNEMLPPPPRNSVVTPVVDEACRAANVSEQLVFHSVVPPCDSVVPPVGDGACSAAIPSEQVVSTTALPIVDDEMSRVQAAAVRAGGAEECRRLVLDLQDLAKKLTKKDIQDLKQGYLANKQAMFSSTGKAMSTFDPLSWCLRTVDFFFGDCFPNQPNRLVPMPMEDLFPYLQDKEELSYAMQSDEIKYAPRARSRFDSPEYSALFGDTLRRNRIL